MTTRCEHTRLVCEWASCDTLGTTREDGWLFCAKHLVEHRVLTRPPMARKPPKPRKPLQPCGTPAAYDRHLRHKELPCDPCTAAKLIKNREKHEARKARKGAAA